MTRTTRFVTALTLCSSAWLMARQSGTPTPAKSSGHASTNASATTRNAELTLQGCITGNKRYTFTQVTTGAIFTLTGSTDQFSRVRNKLVEITANEFPPKGEGNGLPKLRVKDLRVVTEKCPMESRPAETANPSNQGTQAPASGSGAGNSSPHSAAPPNVPNPNISGDNGAPSPGTGNPPPSSPPH